MRFNEKRRRWLVVKNFDTAVSRGGLRRTPSNVRRLEVESVAVSCDGLVDALGSENLKRFTGSRPFETLKGIGAVRFGGIVGNQLKQDAEGGFKKVRITAAETADGCSSRCVVGTKIANGGISNLIYIGVNIRGWVKWKKNPPRECTQEPTAV